MRNTLFSVLTVTALTALLASPSWAQGGPPPGERGPHPEPKPGPEPHRWHGDIHHFHDWDFDYWKGGRWFQGPHEGRDGWWWIVGGVWYFYPTPVYPYPDPYTPPTVVVEAVPSGTPMYWYCPNPAGYYPYVPECFAPWQKMAGAVVAATPVATPAPVVSTTPTAAEPLSPTPPPAAAAAASPRVQDDRQLNSLGAEFAAIDLTGKQAPAKLKDLEGRVEAFRQSLFQRSYNAMDILKDAENLKSRIADQRKKLSRHKTKSGDD